MANYATLDVLADAGGEISSAPRGTETEFVDGYTQVVYQGLMPSRETIQFTYTGSTAETLAVYEFFKQNVKKPFWYSYDGTVPKTLYKLTGNYTRRHVGGVTWSVTASFKEYEGI